MKNNGFSLNVRLLAIIVLVVLVTCVGVYFLHRYQVNRQSFFFLESARSSVEDLSKTEDLLDKVDKIKEIGQKYSQYIANNKEDFETQAECSLFYADQGKSFIKAAAGEKDRDKRRSLIRYGLSFHNSAIGLLENVLRAETEQPELRAKLVDLFLERGNWGNTIEHIRYLVSVPTDAQGLAKLFDHYDLWKRVTPPVSKSQPPQLALARFLSADAELVDREKLLDFLGDDIWMVLDDAKLLAIYGRCQANLEKFKAAEKSFEKAIARSPDDPDLYEQMALILHQVKPPRPADADYWMNEMVDANPASYTAKLKRSRYWNMVAIQNENEESVQLTIKAVCDALGGMQKAITVIADEANVQAASLPQTKELKAALKNLPEKPPATNKQVTPEYQDALLEANRAALALGDNLKGIEDEIEACRDGLLLAAQSEWMTCWLKKVNTKEALKNARRYAMSLTSLFPEFPSGYLVLSEIDQQSGDIKSAITVLRKGSEACGNNTDLLWRLGCLLIDSGMVDDAKKVCKKIAETQADQFAVDHLEARIAYSEGRWQEAAEGFEAVRDEAAQRWPSRAKSLDFLLAECYGRLGDLDKQRDAYFRAASTDRTWLPALIGIAKTKSKSGQIDEAIEDYRLITRLPNSPKSISFDLARLLLAKNLSLPKDDRNWSEVETLINHLQKDNANSLQVSFLKADVYFSQGNDSKAIGVLNGVLETLEDVRKKLVNQLDAEKQRLAKLSGDARDSAQEEMKKIELVLRENAVEQASTLTALAKVAMRKKDWPETERALLEAHKMVGDTVSIRLLQGEMFLARYGKKAAEYLRNLAGNTKNFSKSSRLRLWRELSKLSLRAGDQQQVQILSRAVLRDDPESQEMQVVNFEIAVQKNDIQTIKKILGEIKENEKQPGAFWHYGQAVLSNITAGDNDVQEMNKALSHLEKALKIRPNWAAAWVLAATLHDRQGNAEAAVEKYRKAIDLGSQSTQLIRRTVQLLASLNRFREADEVLRLLGERQDSVTGSADFETSVIKAQIGKYEDALVFARKAAEDSNKAGDFVWLGQLLSIVGRQAKNQQRHEEAVKDLDEAEQAFQKAIELDPTDENAWVAMIQFYGQTAQTEKAEAAIQKAKDNLPPEKSSSAIAQCYEAIGKKQEAEKQLMATVAKSPKDAVAVERLADFYIRNKQIDKAVVQLKKIIDGDVQADIKQKSQARRSYATILFSQGGEAKRKEALGLVEENLKLNSASQVDQYAKAVLLASDLSPAQRKKAIPALEELLAAQRDPNAEIQFTLAKLYLSEDKLQDFKRLMRIVLGGKEKDPRHLVFYTDALIEKNEIDEAGIYLDMLQRMQPDSIVTNKLMARHAFKQRHYETAINVLKDFLNKPQEDKQKQAVNLIEVANLLAEFANTLKDSGQEAISRGFDDEAENVYRKFVDMQPGRELLMAQFLAKQGRLDRGLKLLEKHAPQNSAENVAKTCFNFLQGTSPSADQLRQIDRVLRDSLEKYPRGQDAIILKTALAVLRDFQGREDETESIYRNILEEKPNDATAMNNLAVFLALHKRSLDEARDMIDKAIIDYGNIPGLLDTRALVSIAQNKPKKALDDLSIALNKQPTPGRYFHQAQAYLQDGQKEAARKAIEKAKKMGFKEDSLVGIERRNYQKLKIGLR